MTNVPRDIDALRVGGLRISVRLRNSLRRAHIETLGDLRGVSERQLSGISGFGKGTLNELRQLIGVRLGLQVLHEENQIPSTNADPANTRDCSLAQLDVDQEIAERLVSLGIRTSEDLNRIPASVLESPAVLGSGAKRLLEAVSVAKGNNQTTPILVSKETLSFWMEELLSGVKPRTREIVLLRLGYFGPAPTLEELGERYTLTRERIRQIESKAIAKMSEQFGAMLRQRIISLLDRRTELTYVDLLPLYDDWFDIFDRPSTFFEGLISKLLPGEAFVLPHKGRGALSRIPDNEVRTLSDVLIQTASSLVGEDVDREGFELLARAIAKKSGAPEVTHILLDKAEGMVLFAPDGSAALLGVGRGMESKVEAALRYAGAPKHYSEVVEIVQTITGVFPDERRVHNALGNCDAVLVSRGTYALPEHLNVDPRLRKEVVDLVLDIMRNGPECKQWHCHELLEMLTDQVGELPSIDSGHLLSAVIKGTPGLDYLGRQVWVYVGAKKKGLTNRVDLRQACESIIRAAGRPLTRTELIDALDEHRGTASNFQIHSGGNLVQIGSGLWGLSDRDLGIPLEQQTAVKDALVRHLERNGAGIHISEMRKRRRMIGDEIPNVSGGVVFGLARLDDRLRVYAGQYVGLAEWREPRRLTISAALRQIGSSRIEQMEEGELAEQVERLIGRPVSTMEIQNALPCLTGAAGAQS